jgi:hypothetical protein
MALLSFPTRKDESGHRRRIFMFRDEFLVADHSDSAGVWGT